MSLKRRAGVPEPKRAVYDPNPIYAVDILKDEETGHGRVLTWMSFDPKYGPETEEQISWHQRHDTPGSDTWEVGIPCDTPGFKAQKQQAAAAAV